MDLAFDMAALAAWIDARFDRGGGPGGQHVNKVSTRVTLLLDFEACTALSAAQKELIRRRLARRLSADGRLRIVSDEERSQSANREAGLERLEKILRAAFHVQRPRTATRPTLGSKRRRLDDKRRNSARKRDRSPGGEEV
jgi:ribosome-associated protein